MHVISCYVCAYGGLSIVCVGCCDSLTINITSRTLSRESTPIRVFRNIQNLNDSEDHTAYA
jgi:hypothetical protein